MSSREIKCPECGKWTLWEGDVNDRCLYCDSFLDSRRFSREVEEKLRREIQRENDYFVINPEDGPWVRVRKTIMNFIRWGAIYLQIAFFIIVTVLIVMISLLPG
ncbi:MAG TPA: hypothetical protein VIM55_14710 [Mucilaginibacter sp.]